MRYRDATIIGAAALLGVAFSPAMSGCGGERGGEAEERPRFEAPGIDPDVVRRTGPRRRARPGRRAARARPLPSRVPGGLVGAGRKGLLFADGFESGKLDRWSLAWLFLRTSASIVSKPVRHGKGALEVTLRRSDPMRSKGKRSELAVPGYFALGRAYWYGFSVQLPAGWKEDFQGDVLAQWFATRDKHLGEKGRSPSLALRIKDRFWIVNNRWDTRPLTVKNTAPKRLLWKGAYRRGAWTDWVFHVRWSYGPDGRVRIWKDGELVADARGPNTYNDRVGPILKLGIYKAPWNKPETPSNVTSRRVFFDEVRVGDDSVGYAGVAPPGR